MDGLIPRSVEGNMPTALVKLRRLNGLNQMSRDNYDKEHQGSKDNYDNGASGT